jgi:prepilin-type N-terminal cleavage/methylation domain-containing protein
MAPAPFLLMTPHPNKNDAGFTLVELLVGMAMALVITMAAVAMFSSILDRQSSSTEAADVIGTARNAAEKLTVDIREGEKATVANASELKLVTPCSAITAGATGSCEIKYSCGQEVGAVTYSCSREVGGTRKTVVTGLASKEIFCVYPTSAVGKECGAQGTVAPRYVGVNLEFPNHSDATGSSSTTVLEDGAALHNSPEVLTGL